MLKDLLSGHNIDIRGVGHSVPTVVGQQGRILFFHSTTLVGIGKRAADIGHDRRVVVKRWRRGAGSPQA
jgi:hypothetical protein